MKSPTSSFLRSLLASSNNVRGTNRARLLAPCHGLHESRCR